MRIKILTQDIISKIGEFASSNQHTATLKNEKNTIEKLADNLSQEILKKIILITDDI